MSNATPPPSGRIAQIRQAYKVTKRVDRNIGLMLLLTFLVVGGVFGTLGYFAFGRGSLIGLIITIVFSVLVGILGLLIVFGRRAERAAYLQVEGQVGAAAGALQMLKRGWEVKPAVAFTKNQDVVHRVIGRPGVILVGEGQPGRVRNLLIAEKKKHARIAGEDIPITDLMIGNDDGQIPLSKLNKHVRKLPKKIKPAEMTALLYKVKALDAMRPAAPMPRGPVPTSMKGQRKAMRG